MFRLCGIHFQDRFFGLIFSGETAAGKGRFNSSIPTARGSFA
jgi:hypothetical protein